MNGHIQNTHMAGDHYHGIGTSEPGQTKAQDKGLSRDAMLELARVLDAVLQNRSRPFAAADRIGR